MSKRTLAAIGAAVLSVSLLSGCGKYMEPYKDAPVSGHDDSPAKIINNPDGFSNVAFKCNGTTGIYVAYHGDHPYGAVSTVKSDPECAR